MDYNKITRYKDFDILKYPFNPNFSREDQMSMAIIALSATLGKYLEKLLDPNISDEESQAVQHGIDFLKAQINRAANHKDEIEKQKTENR